MLSNSNSSKQNMQINTNACDNRTYTVNININGPFNENSDSTAKLKGVMKVLNLDNLGISQIQNKNNDKSKCSDNSKISKESNNNSSKVHKIIENNNHRGVNFGKTLYQFPKFQNGPLQSYKNITKNLIRNQRTDINSPSISTSRISKNISSSKANYMKSLLGNSLLNLAKKGSKINQTNYERDIYKEYNKNNENNILKGKVLSIKNNSQRLSLNGLEKLQGLEICNASIPRKNSKTLTIMKLYSPISTKINSFFDKAIYTSHSLNASELRRIYKQKLPVKHSNRKY